jgi:hypothetical protein
MKNAIWVSKTLSICSDGPAKCRAVVFRNPLDRVVSADEFKAALNLARTILLGLDPQLEARSTRHSARSCNVACVQ